ncbi:MAG: hypothetical protein RMJ19_08610 [Gemmatales bacterium]|nr:hypothetical protein [Gemmatales bacterium]MCS7160519.1 hypothetical protein [Gemmatales bacterium]MDW8175720.1 hypothetical protein [Gemmatales bacterium]MDW8222451.1 hypothetical protein [Gemmatales bacterium]
MSAGPVPPQDNPTGSTITPAAELQHGSERCAGSNQGSAHGTRHEPPNPLYGLLLLFSIAFVLTGLVLSLVPWPELPRWLQQHGWKILLGEMGLVIVTGLGSMVLDRWRSGRKSDCSH